MNTIDFRLKVCTRSLTCGSGSPGALNPTVLYYLNKEAARFIGMPLTQSQEEGTKALWGLLKGPLTGAQWEYNSFQGEPYGHFGDP